MKLFTLIITVLFIGLAAYSYNYMKTYTFSCISKGNFMGVEGLECKSFDGNTTVTGMATTTKDKANN